MQRLQIKGVMLDMVRVTEKHTYYSNLLPRLSGWGYNAVFAHFTDDEGCAMRFKKRPALTTKHAYSQDEMRAWIRKAAKHFGVRRAAAVGGAIRRLSEIMPLRQELRPMLDSDRLPAQPLTALECDRAAEMAATAEKQEQVFAASRGHVRRNRADYDNLILAARLLSWAARLALARSEGYATRRQARGLLAEGQKLLTRSIRDWNRGRYADDRKRDLKGKPDHLPGALIPNLHRSLSRLAKRVQ